MFSKQKFSLKTPKNIQVFGSKHLFCESCSGLEGPTPPKSVSFSELKKMKELIKQAGAELCQAQDSLSSLPTGFGLA